MESFVLATLIFSAAAARATSSLGINTGGCLEQLSRCPQSQSASIGNTTVFHCTVEPALSELYAVDWIIQLGNGSLYHLHTLLRLEDEGLASPADGVWSGTDLALSVLATAETNNALVRCRVFEHETAVVRSTKPATLTVIAAPEPAKNVSNISAPEPVEETSSGSGEDLVGCMDKLIRCPESQNISHGSTASFHCEVNPDVSHHYEAEWIVQLENGSLYHQHTLLALPQLGITAADDEWTGTNLTLNIVGTREVNNSRIKCRVFEHETTEVYFTEFAYLRITVPPLELECEKAISGEVFVVNQCTSSNELLHVHYSISEGEPEICDFPLRIDFAEFPAGSYSVDITAVDIFNTIAVTAIQYTKPALQLQFIHDTPQATAATISAEFEANRPVEEMTCFLSKHRSQDCSLGTASFQDLRPKRYTFTVEARAKNGDTATLARNVRVGYSCLVNLINEGLTVNGTSVSVQFSGSADIHNFRCKLDGGHYYNCLSPVQLFYLSAGAHQFEVKPGGCKGVRRRLSFVITP